MKKINIFFTYLLFISPLFFIAYAAGEDSGSSPLEFVFRVMNFLILVGILYYFAKKPVGAGLKSSAEMAKKNLEEAREAKKQAEAELQGFQEKLSNMKQEAESLVANAQKDAENEKERIIAEAEALANRMKEQAKFSIDQEFRKAELELRQWVAKEAVQIAEEMIKKKIDDNYQEKLVKDYISQLN